MFEVEFRDGLRPNRRVIETYDAECDVTVAAAARILDVSTRTIYNWIDDGVIDTVEGSSPVSIPIEDVRMLIHERYDEGEDEEFDEDEGDDFDEDDEDEDYDDDEEGDDFDEDEYDEEY